MKKMFACSTLGLNNERFTPHLQISVEKEHMSIEERKYQSNTITRIKRRSVENDIRRKRSVEKITPVETISLEKKYPSKTYQSNN